MEIRNLVATILLAVFFAIIIINEAHFYFSQKRLNLFLQKAEQNPLLKALLEEISSYKIQLIPFKLFPELLFQRKTIMTMTDPEQLLAISNKFIKGFLNGKEKPNIVASCLAHELGHFLRMPDLPPDEKEKPCKLLKKSCLYEEALASLMGLEILRRIASENNLEIAIEEHSSFLKQTALKQCFHCILFFTEPENAQECQRYKDLQEMGVEIKKENKETSVSLP